MDTPGDRASEELIDSLLERCLASPSPERERELERLCAEHTDHADELRARMRLLRRSGMLATDFDANTALGEPGDEAMGFGKFRVIRELGHGGMGVVYLAEQREPVRRRVALKVIRLGMDSAQVLTRFEVERQALAMMEHSNIAKVFEGGITEQGRPYFAMEFVNGEPLTDYCDRHRLTLRERLELLRQVCAGVQHAHLKSVIHRDLKPSNILVSSQEGHAVPKIIDFGLARATDHRLLAQTIYTEFGQLVGTPEYMAPEQNDLNNVDVDTRVDVYSLGVILYELLAGDLPFPSAELRKHGLGEVQRMIREDDPPKPSTRVASLDASSAESASSRQLDHTSWLRALRGDLDWIVMRAIEKDPMRRYQTAQALADDIGRHLADEPVEARPPSTTYRLRKLVRRHRGRVAAAAVVGIAFLGWLVTSSVLYVQAAAAQREAEARAREADHVADFLEQLFENASPTRSLGAQASVGLLLEQGARRIQQEFAEQPSVRARLMIRIAVAYHWLGEDSLAAPLLREAAAIRSEIGGLSDEARLQCLLNLGAILAEQSNFSAAEKVLTEAHTRIAADHGARTALMADCLYTMSQLLHAQRRMPEALARAREAMTLQRALDSKVYDFEQRMDGLLQLGSVLQDSGEAEPAAQLFQEALAQLERVHPRGDPRSVRVRLALAESQRSLGKLQEAEETLRDAWTIAIRVYGEKAPILGRVLRERAGILRERGLLGTAASWMIRAAEIHQATLPAVHPEVAWSINDLGTIQLKQKRFAAARDTLRRAVKLFEQLHPDGHEFTAIAVFNLGFAEFNLGNLRVAAGLFQRSVKVYDRIDSSGHPKSRVPRGYLGFALMRLGEYTDAVPVYKELLKLDERLKTPESDHWNLVYRGNLGRALCMSGKAKEGLARLDDTIAIRARHVRSPDLDQVRNLIGAAGGAEKLGDLGRAREYADDAARQLEELAAKKTPAALEQALVQMRLASLDLRAEKYSAAESPLRAARETFLRSDPDGGQNTQECTRLLVRLYEARGNAQTAAEFRKMLEPAPKVGNGK